MRTLEQAIAHFQTGRLTATGLMLETLQPVSARNVDSILDSLPSDVVEALIRFVQGYHPGVRVFNGPKPSAESVRIVKGWLAAACATQGHGIGAILFADPHNANHTTRPYDLQAAGFPRADLYAARSVVAGFAGIALPIMRAIGLRGCGRFFAAFKAARNDSRSTPIQPQAWPIVVRRPRVFRMIGFVTARNPNLRKTPSTSGKRPRTSATRASGRIVGSKVSARPPWS